MLVLSLFPGIGLLDRAFEEQGFCIVRGPDLLWGGDIKRFHPPQGRFDGVIGGSPCQCFSPLAALARHNGYRIGENLIPEFERVIFEARPEWWVMENVVTAPIPAVDGYVVDPSVLDNRWLGEIQSRKHRFSFGTRDGRRLRYETAALEHGDWKPRVLASGGYSPKLYAVGKPKKRRDLHNRHRGSKYLAEALALQGLPQNFFEGSPFRVKEQVRMLGNGVPMFMGRALAKAVRAALLAPP